MDFYWAAYICPAISNCLRYDFFIRFQGFWPVLPLRRLCLGVWCAGCAVWAFAQAPKPQMQTISVEQGLSSNHTSVICQDRQGFVWIGTLGGLNRYDGYEIKTFRNLPGDSTSLPSNIITALHEDRQGVLWVGTTMGLSHFSPLDETFTSYSAKPGDPQSLSHNLINYIHEDRDGQLWLSTTGGGLHLFDREKKTFSRYSPQGAGVNSVVTEFCEDRQREHLLWMSVWADGASALYSFDTKTKTFTRCDMGRDWSNDAIHSVVEDRSGHLWVGTAHGVLVFDKATQKFARFGQDPNAPKEEVITSMEDRQGAMWVCGYGSGLHRYDPMQRRFERYVHDPIDSKSLSSNQVHSVMEDRSGVKVVTSKVPLAEMFAYSTSLRSMTQGRGNYTMQFSHYEEAPRQVSEEIIAKAKGTR